MNYFPDRAVRTFLWGFLMMGLSLGEGTGFVVDFEQTDYTVGLNATLTLKVEVTYEVGEPTDLFSYGVKVESDVVTFTAFLDARVPSALDFNGVLGPPAFEQVTTTFVGIKGTVDTTAVPLVYYAGTDLAEFDLSFSQAGIYNLDVDFFNTLGPTEDIFVAGDGTVLDSVTTFGMAEVTVVPEPTAAVLVLPFLLGFLVRRRTSRRGRIRWEDTAGPGSNS